MSTAVTVRKYGWRPDKPDQRDLVYKAPKSVAKTPLRVDLRTQCPPVYDQGQLGACTANAIGGHYQFDLLKQNDPSFVPARLFIYYNERVIEGTTSEDAGAEIRDGIKSIASQGVCPETMWPYDIPKFATKPPQTCYTSALSHVSLQYNRITTTLPQLKACLAEGFPFVFGFSVYESFESAAVAKSGIVNMPAVSEKMIGGHAAMAVGYDDTKSRFIVRNSWGADWGLKGYFTIPYAYLTNSNLADDFWTIRLVKG